MPITATIAPDAATALEQASAFLRRDPIRNNVILSVLSDPEPTDTAAIVEGDGEVVGVALLSRSGTSATLTTMPEPAVDALVDALADIETLTSVTGPTTSVTALSRPWMERLGRVATPGMEQLLYESRHVITPPPPARGSYQPAPPALIDTLVEREVAFAREHNAYDPDVEQLHDSLTKHVADGRFRVWDIDGVTVSTVRFSPPIAGATRISAVHTPRPLRRNGYSAALVSALTQELLDAGLRPMLYTDRSYVPANRLYQGIGYEIVDEYADVVLTR